MHVGRRLQSATTATMAALLSWRRFHHAARDTAVMIVNTREFRNKLPGKYLNETAGRVLTEVL